jgi:hypothetical protein
MKRREMPIKSRNFIGLLEIIGTGTPVIHRFPLVGHKITLAKLNILVQGEGFDVREPQISLVQIHGAPVKQEERARVKTQQPYATARAGHHAWSAKLRIRWDADQFAPRNLTDLLAPQPASLLPADDTAYQGFGPSRDAVSRPFYAGVTRAPRRSIWRCAACGNGGDSKMKSRMTVAEIAMRLGLGKRTIYATLEAGIMPGGAAGPALDRHAARL